MLILQPVSWSRGWQVESSLQVPDIVKRLTGNLRFILAQVLPPVPQALC